MITGYAPLQNTAVSMTLATLSSDW